MLTLTAELRPLNSIFHNGLRHKINSRRFSIVLPEPHVWDVAVLVNELYARGTANFGQRLALAARLPGFPCQ
jgi:hypothetical protein